MRPNTVFLAGGVIAIAFGLSFLLVPGTVLPMYGAPADATTVLMSRFFGVALLQVGLMLYLLRETRDAATQRSMALAGVVGSVVGVLVSLMGVMGGAVNALGWSTVAIYAALLLGYLSAMRSRPALA
jgi:FtsH-binding integral membrane protein